MKFLLTATALIAGLEYAVAPTWRAQGATAPPNDATIRIALARN